MMTIEEMNQIRTRLGLTYQQICIASGIPIGTVQKVLGGVTKNPRIETMRRLEETLGEIAYNYNRHHTNPDANSPAISCVREVSPYSADAHGHMEKQPHVWTAEERDALPAYRRTELIDGILYDMAAPSPLHQDIAVEIYNQINECIRKHHVPCRAYMAPTDVALDRDDYTVVQPDVFVVCDRTQITIKNIQGAPAFVLEVLSPSTYKIDQIEKLRKYSEAGVKEYWMVNPKSQKVIVFSMPDNTEESGFQPYDASIYGFTDRIPLLISAGKCVIDMPPILQLLEELYPEEFDEKK